MGRKTADRDARPALEKGLRGLFRRLADRPVPDRIRSVVDQLDESTPTEAKKAG